MTAGSERNGRVTDEDAALARRLRQRDPEAMEEVYERYGGFIYTLLSRTLRSRVAAEEQTQEVFLRVWNSIFSFDEKRGGLAAWIGAIARNRAVDYMRSPYGQMDRRGRELSEAMIRTQADNLDTALMARGTLRLLRTLSGKQRQVLRLAYFEGKTQNEIAAEMQEPLGTVKTWARLGLRTLRKQMTADAVK